MGLREWFGWSAEKPEQKPDNGRQVSTPLTTHWPEEVFGDMPYQLGVTDYNKAPKFTKDLSDHELRLHM